MAVFTIGQNQTLEQHLAWCAQIIEENERDIAMFKSGKMRMGDGATDITSAWVKRLENQNEHLRRVVKDFKPAGFQQQVKS